MDNGVHIDAHKAAVLRYNLAVRHVEDSNLQAAAAELRPLLSHTADALDDVVTMRAAALLVEVYLRQGVSTAASDLLDDLQTRFGSDAGGADGLAKAATASSTPCQEWAVLLAGLWFRVAVATGNFAAAQLRLQTFTALCTEAEQGDVEVAKGSMLDLLSSAHAASAQDRAVALGNLGCLVARDWQHNLALLCFSRALSISKESCGEDATLALDAFQAAHMLRCAASQHQALGEHVAGIRCLHGAATLTPADSAVWLLLGWAIAELAACPAPSPETFQAVINVLGIVPKGLCDSCTQLLDCAELAADTAEHILEITKQHSANGAEAGNSDALLVQIARAAQLRIRLQQLQDAAASAKPQHAALSAVWDNLRANQTTTALAMLREMAQEA